MKFFLKFLPVAIGTLVTTPAAANIFEDYPDKWRLESYADGRLSIFYAPSTCANGAIRMLATDSDGVKDRLISMIVSARAMHLKIGIFFDGADGCRINSF